MQKLLVLFVTIILLSSCKKDQIDTVTISGNVKNLCTDSGFANVEVFLFTDYNSTKLFHHSSSSDKIVAVTNSNGDFVFNNFSINHNSDYTYTLVIEDYDHYLNNEYGHSGISAELDKDKVSSFKQIGIIGRAKLLNFYLPINTVINPPDTFKLKIEQPIFHQNLADNVWEVNFGSYTNVNINSNNALDNIGAFPMGWCHIFINKFKSGTNTTINDSIYLGMGATASYTIPW